MYSMICICRGAVVIPATQDSSSSCPTSFVLCLCRVCLGRFSLSPFLPLSLTLCLFLTALSLSYCSVKTRTPFSYGVLRVLVVVVGRKPRRITQRRQTTFWEFALSCVCGVWAVCVYCMCVCVSVVPPLCSAVCSQLYTIYTWYIRLLWWCA